MNEVKIGDWIRFQLGGKLVVGVINYIIPRKAWEHSNLIVTDAGSTQEEYILEKR